MNDLMQRRFKVIADYPDSPANVGEIFTKIEGIQNYTNGRFSFDVRTLERYPHLFKELQWWEERSLDEMPKYVKYIVGDKIYKVGKISTDGNWFVCDTGNSVPFSQYFPATEEEYNSYIKTKQQIKL